MKEVKEGRKEGSNQVLLTKIFKVKSRIAAEIMTETVKFKDH